MQPGDSRRKEQAAQLSCEHTSFKELSSTLILTSRSVVLSGDRLPLRDKNRKGEKTIDGTQNGEDVITLYCHVATRALRCIGTRYIAVGGRPLIDTIKGHSTIEVKVVVGLGVGDNGLLFVVFQLQ